MGTLEQRMGDFVMEEEKGVEVEYNFTINDNIDSMKNLLMSFSQTNSFEDAKEATTDMINTMIDVYIGYHPKNQKLTRSIFNPNNLSCKLTFLGDNDICIQMTLFYTVNHKKMNYAKTIGRVMTLEDITDAFLADRSDEVKEFVRCRVMSKFADYVAELFEEMVNYVTELEMGE
jgi:hypothetical protein